MEKLRLVPKEHRTATASFEEIVGDGDASALWKVDTTVDGPDGRLPTGPRDGDECHRP